MKFFDIFKGKHKRWIEIYSPINGRVIPLEEVPDEAFAQKMIGDGCAIDPTEGAIYSPLEEAEIDIFETNHAISFETSDGFEMIVHFGIDTVKLNGKGLDRVIEIDSAKKGDKLIEYDLEFLRKNAKSVKTPIIITSMDMVDKIEVMVDYGHDVKVGQLLMRVCVCC